MNNKHNIQSVELNFRNLKGECGGVFSDMAIDDVSLSKGPCANLGACTFENSDYCNWMNIQDSRDNFDWEFGSADTSTAGTGPEYI